MLDSERGHAPRATGSRACAALPPGRLSLASAAREVPPDPAPHSCPARPEPRLARPLLAPRPAAPNRGPQELWVRERGTAGSRAGQPATTELASGPPRTRVSPRCPQPSTSTPLPPPATQHQPRGPPNSTPAGRQAAHTPWGSDARGGRGLEHPPPHLASPPIKPGVCQRRLPRHWLPLRGRKPRP